MGDAVNHPPHYIADPSGVECIEITRHRTFNVGNAIKYLWRAGRKGAQEATAEDLNKALWYIADEIGRIGGKVTCSHSAMGGDKRAWDLVLLKMEHASAQLNAALVAIFGAEADAIEVSHLDHLCGTLTPERVEALLHAVGGPWAAILHRIAEKRTAAKAAKDPGEDVRMKAGA